MKQWMNGFGEITDIDKLDHQHLSNILWYNEIFRNWTLFNSRIQIVLELELMKRFGRIRLAWKPLPIPSEIEELKALGLINDNDDIVSYGEVIGSIKHLNNNDNEK